jgi:hypothetical protein
MKVEQAKQIASKTTEELSQALERGHSEVLRNYLAQLADSIGTVCYVVLNIRTSCCGKLCKRREVFPTYGPHCSGGVFLCIRHCSFSFFPFLFSSGFPIRKKKQIPFIAGTLRTGACAVKGGGVKRFIGAKRKPLTEQARDRAQPLAEKGICCGTFLV